MLLGTSLNSSTASTCPTSWGACTFPAWRRVASRLVVPPSWARMGQSWRSSRRAHASSRRRRRRRSWAVVAEAQAVVVDQPSRKCRLTSTSAARAPRKSCCQSWWPRYAARPAYGYEGGVAHGKSTAGCALHPASHECACGLPHSVYRRQWASVGCLDRHADGAVRLYDVPLNAGWRGDVARRRHQHHHRHHLSDGAECRPDDGASHGLL